MSIYIDLWIFYYGVYSAEDEDLPRENGDIEEEGSVVRG